MKKNFVFSWIVGFILIIGLVIIGCNKTEADDSPSSVMKQCLESILKGDAKTVSELWVEPEPALRVFATITDLDKADAAEILKTGRFEETIKGNKAVVKAIYKDGSTSEMDFVKVNRKWKICIGCSDPD